MKFVWQEKVKDSKFLTIISCNSKQNNYTRSMKRILPLLFPLSLWAQSLQEMGFSKVELSDTLSEIINRGIEFDKDTSICWSAIEIEWDLLLVNYMKEPDQLSYFISKYGKKAEVFFILDNWEWWTRTEIDWVLTEDKSKHLYKIISYLPSKYKKL